jgi:type VI secretion system protein ImpH
VSAAQGKTLAQRFDDAPELFDPDIARLVQDTLPNDALENLKAGDISNPTNLMAPTVFSKDASRAGEDRVSANYLGMLGPVAALPASYTHAAILERKRRSGSLFNFFELFAAELRQLFVDAHRKYRLPSLFQLYRSGVGNKISGSIFALLGFATERERAKLTVDEEIPLYYAGYFADQRRTAICLECMLNDYLGFPVKVSQFQLRRLKISEDEQTRLGEASLVNAALGQTAVAGATSPSRRGSIRVTIGPLDYPQYLSLMPDRMLYAQLTELIRLYCGPSIMFDIQLVLRKEHVPQTRLDHRSRVGRLGWDSWALGGGARTDSRDTVFDPDSARPAAKAI